MEDWEVEENTNINVLEETEENCLPSLVNVLDEVP
jgi:hypothetical protein